MAHSGCDPRPVEHPVIAKPPQLRRGQRPI